ncbi:MAG: DUF5074 domain-containing protein [Paraprevotella sp.]|nr:DUF5074 domain-containing protein [Paraprevotella sp.]
MRKTILRYAATSVLLSVAALTKAQADYTDGVFMLNEDWYGHNNSTLNFIRPDNATDPFEYYIIQSNEANAGQSLGATAQFGAIYGDNIYIISKQDQDAGSGLSPGETGESRRGGRIVVADARTMEIKCRIPVIKANAEGTSVADGRSFVGVDETKAYVGTSNGIYVLDLSSFEITRCIEGTENPLVTGHEDNADGTGPLYQNQIGMMLRTPDYVFAIQQDKGILVIDPQTDRVVRTIEGCFSTMTMSKDGQIWAGHNSNMDYQHYPYGNMGSSGECWEGTELLRIDPETFETEAVRLNAGGINQSWYAWNAGSLCAGTKENVLYFTYNDNKWSWFTTSKLYKFDVASRTSTLLYDSSTEGRYFYGAALRADPSTDRLYAALYLDNVVQSYWVYQMSPEGKVLQALEPIDRYWFPALFIFPDNQAPEVDEFPDLTLEDDSLTIDLSDMATDADSPSAAIVKSVKGNSHAEVVDATIRNNRLTLRPRAVGESDLILRFNSNGKCVDRTLHVRSLYTDVRATTRTFLHVRMENGRLRIEGLEQPSPVEIYDLAGRLVRRTTITPGQSVEDLPDRTGYLVRIGQQTFKVM